VRASALDRRTIDFNSDRLTSSDRFVRRVRLKRCEHIAHTTLPEEGMTTATTNVPVAREPRLLGQTVVVIGGSAGIGLETARLARSEGAEVVLTGRDPERLEQRRASSRREAAPPSTPTTQRP
jgi:threonine dehydrogenase-like Zn-dependent dehydrogenase